MKPLSDILHDIVPYVIVTGSYARRAQTELSDIDFFVKEKTEAERDQECEEKGIDYSDTEETYVEDLIRYFESLGYSWSSCFLGSFAIDDTEIPLEFSAYYSIDGELFETDICGVKMIASKSNYTGGKYVNGEKISHCIN